MQLTCGAEYLFRISNRCTVLDSFDVVFLYWLKLHVTFFLNLPAPYDDVLGLGLVVVVFPSEGFVLTGEFPEVDLGFPFTFVATAGVFFPRGRNPLAIPSHQVGSMAKVD
jgi:hypothetical protein